MQLIAHVALLVCVALVLLISSSRARSQTVTVPNGVDLDAEIFRDSHGYSGCGISVFAVVALPRGYTGVPKLMEAYSFDLVLTPKGKGAIAVVKATTQILKMSANGHVSKKSQAEPREIAFGIPGYDKPIRLLNAQYESASASILGILPGARGAQVLKTLLSRAPLLVFFQMSSNSDDVLSVAGKLKPEEQASVAECLGGIIDSIKDAGK